MRPRHSGSALALACAFLALAATGASAAGLAKGHGKRVCGAVSGPVAACQAEVLADAAGVPLATASYQSGYAPNDLRSAYNVAGAAIAQGGAQTVAIVDAYDAPNAEADLATYRAQFGLSPCTTANGCFQKVNQSGGTTPPAVDAGWAQEISLDLDMVSALCPNCRILLVEANSASYANLAAAVDRAATMGATQISNSYGGSEQFGGSYESHYNHPGIDITVSSGDSGYGVEFPASSPHVTAVGGTRLLEDGSARGWSETVWSGAGSGCSGVFSKPSFQHDSGCSRRSVADVSAVADPNTGVAVYDSYPYQGASGWFVFGGTSVAAPVIGAIDALAGGRSPGTTYGGFAYANPSLFNDIVSGSNGSCGGSYLCTGAVGYDGPTGVGTPNGAGAAGPAAPDFTIAVSPSSRTIRRGTSTTYTVTIAPSSGFSGSVTLSATGAPAGSGVSFSPPSTSSTSTMTVTTSATAPTGTYTLTVTGTSGTLSHSAGATLVLRKK